MSGYHHFDICRQQHTFLGFLWKNKLYCFSVLIFGVASSPYLFSKCLRAMVKFWRQKNIIIVLYLDDGFVMAQTYDDCDKVSTFVRKSLLDAGWFFFFSKRRKIYF